ncbi:SDR family NAD(P)-dependent oxidoreductase [Nocardioides marinus]|uniref:Probable oxidoreductase n=1 Tax=Nocardioides marinus TaxID=374514 RepID=A0A7Z0C3A8_9ACTN|nr:NAD(P)-dependent dehydrogenase (short-subunit alcohol dehydrogenase family) [Nocardioides marinus]
MTHDVSADIPSLRQRPVGSPFGATSTAEEVLSGVDLSGARALVTGGYAGIGLALVRALAQAGAEVLAPARRPQVAREALADVPGATVAALDLSEQQSVATLAEALDGPLDLLVLNAGVMACPETRTPEGWELQLATNHLGHFSLVNRLLPHLVPGGRVVSVSSLGHHHGGMHWEDPMFEQDYAKWRAYGQSKSANALLAVHLAESGVAAYSLHPGAILTDLGKHLTEADLDDVLLTDADGNLVVPSFKTPEQGAATAAFAATSDLLTDRAGAYLEDCEVAPLVDGEGLGDHGVRRWAVDPAEAARLWAWSAELTGVDALR